MSDDHALVLRAFCEEAVLRLDDLRGLLREIEGASDHRAAGCRFFIVAHTMKGSAGMARLPVIAALAAAFECIARQLCDGVLRPSAALLEQLAWAIEALAEALGRIERGAEAPATLAEALSRLRPWLGRQLEAAPTSDPCLAGFVLGEYDQLRLTMLRAQGRRLVRIEVPIIAHPAGPLVWAADVQRRLREVGNVVATSPPASELEGLAAGGTLAVLLATECTPEEVALRCARAGCSQGVEHAPHRSEDGPDVQ